MQRVLPETDFEKKLMCLGAMYIEENHVLDELFQVVGADLVDSTDLAPEVRGHILDEIGEYFFRLDMNYGPDVKGDCLEILEDFWGVTDKKSALQTLEDIRRQGHRTKFNVLMSALPTDGTLDSISLDKFKQIFSFDYDERHPIQMSDEDYRKLAQWMQRTQKYLKAGGILAWDVARSIQLIRLCFVAEFLSDNEAWAEILKLGPLVDDKFGSWMEFAQSFLIGRTFWSGAEDSEAKNTCERLLGHPASPWQFFECRWTST